MKRFFQNNGGLLLLAAVLLAAVLTLGAYILGYDPLGGAMELLATPFRTASAAVTNWTQEQYDRTFRYDEQAADIGGKVLFATPANPWYYDLEREQEYHLVETRQRGFYRKKKSGF